MAKITQGIGKKLNPSEARASISLHKIAQKKPGLLGLKVSINFTWSVHGVYGMIFFRVLDQVYKSFQRQKIEFFGILDWIYVSKSEFSRTVV